MIAGRTVPGVTHYSVLTEALTRYAMQQPVNSNRQLATEQLLSLLLAKGEAGFTSTESVIDSDKVIRALVAKVDQLEQRLVDLTGTKR